ncbi:hypothetical protein BVY01_02760 [bacterium I07]|nr:hypothetical protein BVY01_02760 [bacterium I07]
MQLSFITELDRNQLLIDLFQAYYSARTNKRNTINALAFERHCESNVFALYDELVDRTYEPRPSICFVVDTPVKREIFAASFRDRVIHHYIFTCISPIFEKTFINDSYSCRKGKGTHYGIKRIDHFIRSCSENYQKDCYILKLDIKGYFMAMNRMLLFHKIKSILTNHLIKIDFDLSLVLWLIEKTIFNDPTKNGIRKSKRSDWIGLPENKSLFRANKDCGFPIGNLTSQLFGNIYLNDFDHFVKRDLRIRYYGRYVDDIILIHRDKEYLKSLISVIKDNLSNNLKLELHSGKIYLQHFTKGVKYLGAVIKPYRIYVANRTKGNFVSAVEKQNRIVLDHKPTAEEKEKFLSSMNSYLGILKHYKTYKLRRKIISNNLSGWWWNYAFLSGGIKKIVFKQRRAVR